MPRTVRRARNRAFFREVNEQIAGVSGAVGDAMSQGFICECHQLGCTETIQLPLAVFAQLRDDESAFIVLPGHEDLDHETIVVREPGYVVVRDGSPVTGPGAPD